MKIMKMILIISLSLIFLLTGCASEKPQVSVDAALTQSNNQSSSGENQGEPVQERRNQDRADLIGRVKSIIGNEVVLELMEMPVRASGQESSVRNQGGTVPQGQFPQNPGGMPGGIPGGGAGGAGGGAGFTQRTGVQREVKLTGETETFFIPVGVPINSFGTSGSKELDIADLYQGNTLQIWYDNETDKNIIRIMVIQGR